jgi:chromate transporter
MIYVEIFWAFFVPNIIGYGGGPAIIPLIEAEVVGRLEWKTPAEFAEILAMGNALPSPIATKMAAQIGYEVGGILGAIVALLATVAPSILMLLLALSVIHKFRDKPQVKRMSNWVRPVIAVMMAVLVYSFAENALAGAGLWHSLVIGSAAIFAIFYFKLHPAIVIAGSLFYGVLLMG